MWRHGRCTPEIADGLLQGTRSAESGHEETASAINGCGIETVLPKLCLHDMPLTAEQSWVLVPG
jgi:hypothetical protein